MGADTASVVAEPEKHSYAQRFLTNIRTGILEWTDEHCRTGELGCVDCKTNLADLIIDQLAPFRERRAELAAKPGLVSDVLAAGADRVRPVVESTMAAVRNAMHFA